MVNVSSELDATGAEEICIQVLKLSADIWRVPEQLVSEILVVTVLVFIPSEKITEMLSLNDTELWLSEGEVEETIGAIVSIIIDLVDEGLNRLKIFNKFT